MKRRISRVFRTALFFALLLSAIVARAQVQASGERAVSVVVAGDVMANMRVKEAAYRIGAASEAYFGSLFDGIRPVVAFADLAFANLETPISKSEPNTPAPFIFNAPQAMLTGLKWAGFDVLSLANNHSLDQKLIGLRETVAAVAQEGLVGIGVAGDREAALMGHVAEVRGLKIGFLAFTSFLNGGQATARASESPYINLAEREKDLLAAIDSMRKRADVVILSLHWGVEYETVPRAWQRRQAAALHERGVDIIVGHHPHVLQPIQWHRGKNGRRQLTIFSLGNLISNQSTRNARDGALVELHLAKEGVKSFRVYPTWTDNWKGPEEGIRTVRISDEMLKVDEELKRLKPSPQRTFLLERRQLLNERFENIYKTLGLKRAPTSRPRP